MCVFRFSVSLFVCSFYLSRFSEPCPCVYAIIFKRSSLPNHGDELRVLLEVSLLHFPRSATTTDYSLYFVRTIESAGCTMISRTCNTWSLNVSTKRKRKKKRGEENRGTHPPSVSLSLPPANTIILSPSVSVSLFSFSTVLLLSIKKSSGRRFLLSVLLNTNLAHWIIFVENRRRSYPCSFNYLSFFYFSLSFSLSLFLNKVRKGIACASIEINLREVDRSRGRREKNKDPGRAIEMDERNHKIPDEGARDETCGKTIQICWRNFFLCWLGLWVDFDYLVFICNSIFLFFFSFFSLFPFCFLLINVVVCCRWP